jgi:intracellular septation protein A
MYFLGAILGLAGLIWMVVNAAKRDGALAAILCFICGFYTLYYGIKNFAEDKVPFLIWIGGIVLMVAFRPDMAALQQGAGM